LEHGVYDRNYWVKTLSSTARDFRKLSVGLEILVDIVDIHIIRYYRHPLKLITQPSLLDVRRNSFEKDQPMKFDYTKTEH